MRAALGALQTSLGRDVPQLVDRFDPPAGLRNLLAKLDAFRVQRVVDGHPQLADQVDQAGAAGLLRRRTGPPPPPNGFGLTPPGPPALKDRWLGLVKVKWADREPVTTRDRQNGWYRWRTDVAWSEAWARHRTQWQGTLDRATSDLDRLVKALLTFAHEDEERFKPRAEDLYRRRVGVSYLLPPGGAEMERFYQQVIQRLIGSLVQDGRLQPAATEPDLLQALVGAGGWRDAYATTIEVSPEQAVIDLRDLVKTHVQSFLRDAPTGQRPLLPRLHDLLAEAAGHAKAGGASSQQDYVDEFRGKLAGLVPAAFTPQGAGPMKALITYPADSRSPVIEEYLRESISLPVGHGIVYDMKNTEAESISVVLFRTSMGVTEVDEVRTVLRLWSAALARPEPNDYLRWRQRTGYEFGYLATTEEHRVTILHRLLCAMWNGKVTAQGDEESPALIRVELDGGVAMNLPLSSFERTSSWASMLRAYELWTFSDDEIRRRFCDRLMREVPFDEDGQYGDPSPLYTTMLSLADAEVMRLDKLLATLPPDNRVRAAQQRSFWKETLPAALDLRFTGMEGPPRPNLRLLGEAVVAGSDQ
jgi:hypothetical protein